MSELDKIKKNPYTYIRNHYEKMYPCVGSKVFSLLSLVPVSLIIPKIMRNSKEVRVHINLLWLSGSGLGKSSLCREFEKITYNPLSTNKMTTARLYHELKQRNGNKVSLIVEDVSVWFMEEDKIKFLEGVTGEEEKVSHETMKNIKKSVNHVDLVAFCSGTPENITNQRIKTGILRRFSPLILFLSQEENNQIIDFINKNMGVDGNLNSSEPIIDFYKQLYEIQEGNNPDMPPIIGYIFPEHIKEEINRFMKEITSIAHKKFAVSSATETEEVYRFLVAHAFLNIFNKKEKGLIQDNKLIIDDEDLFIAKHLISREISAKNMILTCIDQMDFYGIRTRDQLREWEERRKKMGKGNIPPEAKLVMETNLK
jgi:hypothetical protein